MDFSLALNADFLDSQYERWKTDPESLSREWQRFFEGFEFGFTGECRPAGVCDRHQMLRQSRVDQLIHRYRDLGHLLSCLDPLSSCPTEHPLLSLPAVGLTDEDLDRSFFVPETLGSGEMVLRDILRRLKETYCRSVGVEYMHLQDPGERLWLQERLESSPEAVRMEPQERLRILNKMLQASLFDQFLHSKYLGQKRFSIEGAEVVVAMLDALVQHLGARGCREVIFGMAHRGRLNVQANVLGKPYEAIFCHFEDSYDPDSLVGSGDVKYHMGHLADVKTAGERPMRLVMAANASHLESVNPVVQGMTRARQEILQDKDRQRVVPLLIHGDAAFAGQGVVAETLNLSQLEGYTTGGTLHLIINNQIGFTTLPEDARSTRYATDVAKMLMVPIFHVHGENPEAAVRVIRLAADYRTQFAKDVVIDVVCYRKYGHSEGDEPYYTQPRMYDRIKDRTPSSRLYAEKLIQDGIAREEEIQAIEAGIRECIEGAYRRVHDKTCPAPAFRYFEEWESQELKPEPEVTATGVPEKDLKVLGEKLTAVPDGFSVHPKLLRILEKRLETVRSGEGIDWATAEALAFASLVVEGTPVRLSGEDSRRGTFSQRHSVLVDSVTGVHHCPAAHLSESQAPFMVYDSMLSENAVLGFEYGYAITDPHALVIWEAQFGDFANNAQVVIDQYIVSGEAKWGRRCGLVMLLPHGFEGQGPEHSSARLERFLQLCAQDNLQVCQPTTPAQYFHLLRRQARRKPPKPLVVMAPKSLLRHPLAVSSLDRMSSGRFQEVLDDPDPVPHPRRVLICSGRVFYDLVERRVQEGARDVAVVRLEQLYPFPETPLRDLLAKYATAGEWLWVQDEPENMGGWHFVRRPLEELIERPIGYVGRRASASPASGYHSIHKLEQAAILSEAFGPSVKV